METWLNNFPSRKGARRTRLNRSADDDHSGTAHSHRLVTLTICSVFAALAALVLPSAGARADVDVSTLIAIEDAYGRATASAGRFDRRTGEMRYTASLRNVTNTVIVGPLYVSVNDITAPGVFDKHHDTSFSTGKGVYIVSGDLDPRQTIKKELTFHNPERYRFEFDVRIWADAAANPHLN